MKGKEKLCAKLSSAFLRKWWLVIGFAVLLLLFGVAVTLFFSSWVNFIIGHELVLREGADSFSWWSKPPVIPEIRVYIFNVTNADEFLNNGTKPIVDELGPYVYKEAWERKNIKFNDNGTVSYNLEKIYQFDEAASVGPEDDVVVVPNIPMLSATSQSKHAARFLRLAMASIMDILKIKPFVEVSVGQLLWGYEDPLLKLAKDVVSKDQKLPYEEFGLLYGKNGTSTDRVTVFTGAGNIKNIGQIDKYNGRDSIPHWTNPQCASLFSSDGSLFPPFMDTSARLYIYDKDLCRRLPLVFDKEVTAQGNVTAYRFTPPEDVFASVDKQPENMCYCPHGPPCAPNGLFNISLCQYDSPVMLSFPHFYLADESLRLALDGISPPDPEKHKFSIDVSPLMGVTLGVKARVQMNLAVTQVVDIKQVATFPDIVFPVIWFEEIVPGLPAEVTDLVKLASNVTPIARTALMIGLFAIGTILLVVAIYGLIKAANAHSTLRLNNPINTTNASPTKRGITNNAMQMENVTKY